MLAVVSLCTTVVYGLRIPSHLLCFYSFVLGMISVRVDSALLASSELQLCTRDGSLNSSDVFSTCLKKFVVAIAVDGGSGSGESVVYQWASATDAASGAPVALSDPVTITVTKSQPRIRYPVYYVRNFNAAPYEAVVYTGIFGCSAESSSSSPTCGRAYSTSTGGPIPYSEGYCCSCSLCDLVFLCDSDSRASIDCSLFGDAQAASCLRFSDRWYSGYAIGLGQRAYTIQVNITSPRTGTTVLQVGPEALGAVDQSSGVSVRLVGDFSGFTQTWDFTSRMLFVPAGSPDDPLVEAGPAEWLVVPSTVVTVDGTECNKIGISYEGFNGQGNRCAMRAASCTRNQLNDLRSADIASLASGKAASYLLSAYGSFDYDVASTMEQAETASAGALQRANNIRLRNMLGLNMSRVNERRWALLQEASDASGGDALQRRLRDRKPSTWQPPPASSSPTPPAAAPHRRSRQPQAIIGGGTPHRMATHSQSTPYVSYIVHDIAPSLLTLSFVADNIRYVVNVANGTIASANITASRIVEATTGGVLLVVIANNGHVVADYYLQVRNCSSGTFPMTAQVAAIAPGHTYRATFQVVAQAAPAMPPAASSSVSACTVSLLNSVHQVLDQAVVQWLSVSNNASNGAQDGNGNGGGASAVRTSAWDAVSCPECPWYNPLCFLQQQCFWAMIFQFVAVLGMIACLILLLKWRHCITQLCSSSKTPRRSRRRRSRSSSSSSEGKVAKHRSSHCSKSRRYSSHRRQTTSPYDDSGDNAV